MMQHDYTIMKLTKKTLAAVLLCGAVNATAQTVADELKADVRRVAGLYYALPMTESAQNTPPPAGKRPFYVNHYGCPSAYYQERPEYYDADRKSVV